MTAQQAKSPNPGASLTTQQFAAAIGILSQSVRKRWAKTGSYFGIRPLKLPNGRLRWPDGPIEKLTTEQMAAMQGSDQ